MKKIIRLDENDVEKIVRRIIFEEKFIKEGPISWLRGKMNKDEEIGLMVLKAVEGNHYTDYRKEPIMRHRGKWGDRIHFNLLQHRVTISEEIYVAGEIMTLDVDGQELKVSKKTLNKIWMALKKREIQKSEGKIKDIKTSLKRYDLPSEERKKIEDTDSIFDSLS